MRRRQRNLIQTLIRIAEESTEDLLAPILGPGASAVGWCTFVLVAWRLGWSGLRLVCMRAPEPDSPGTATAISLVFALSGWLAFSHALPVWGWR